MPSGVESQLNRSKRPKPGATSSFAPVNTLTSVPLPPQQQHDIDGPESEGKSVGETTTLLDTPGSHTSEANMVKEREPPTLRRPAGDPFSNLLRTERASNTSQPRVPSSSKTKEYQNGTIQFGTSSSLRNPLIANDNPFNKWETQAGGSSDGPKAKIQASYPGATSFSSGGSDFQMPHRAGFPFLAPADAYQPGNVDGQLSTREASGFGATSSDYMGFRMPPGYEHLEKPTLKPFAQPTQSNSTSPDVFEIPRPTQFQPKTTFPAPRPTFSSMVPPYSGGTIFQTTNPALRDHPNAIDLTSREDEGIDPDEGLRNVPFGAPDPYSYVDSAQAQENIKQLLEGAFDDEGGERLRLKRRTRKQAMKEEKSLVNKLKQLEVKEKEAEEEAEEDEDEDDGTVEGLAVKLLPHQVEGVAWMMDKEISHKKKTRGGVLADDMGLGKTIQSVALILMNPRPSKEEGEKDKKNKIAAAVSKSTLVVAPLALIKQWESEVKTKVEQEHALRVLVHHGASRTKRGADLKKYDIVITTYQTLTSEHAANDDDDSGIKTGCFGVHWYRVILDEAHSIKNRSAKSTQACYALRSHYRWCLTGTPMQNNLDELQSLIRFLGIKPYSDIRHWKDQITNPMKNGRGGLAMRRLQIFLKACMKRRTKDVLKKEGALNPGGKTRNGEEAKGFKIVERKVETVVAEFDPDERRFYDRLSARALNSLEEMMGGEKTDYIGALVLLLRLRQACNHPELVGSKMQNDNDALPIRPTGGLSTPRKQKSAGDGVDDLADMLGGLSVKAKNCDVCQTRLTREDVDAGSSRCAECDGDLKGQRRKSDKKRRARKKHRKSKGQASGAKAKSKHRPIVIESDDKDEEGEGDWVVPKAQQKHAKIGKAGDTDDEDAEGGGEWLKSEDSRLNSEDEEQEEYLNRASKLAKRDVKQARRDEKAFYSDDAEDTDEGSDEKSDENSDDESSGPDAEGTSSESSFSLGLDKPSKEPSTKIRHLLRILAKESPKHKVIVFSQFTTMLDLIEPFLHAAGHTFTRYDGKMRNDAREASLLQLRTNPRVRVLLCSLKCGSLGLNLTAASRVVIVEPFWNPFVEGQAIDRVHRLNQTRDVVVYRLTIADSVEERILVLQEAKRRLATTALEGGKANMNISMKDILKLFQKEAEHEHPVELEPAVGAERVRVLHGATGVAEDERKREKPGMQRRAEDPLYGRR